MGSPPRLPEQSQSNTDITCIADAKEHAINPVDTNDENEESYTEPVFISFSTELPRKPRAWQRLPATPFARRAKSQKIWKRIPLNTIASDVNTEWERGVRNVDGIMRPVKKMRVVGTQTPLLESVNSATMQWENESSPVHTARRRQPSTPVYFRIYDDAQSDPDGREVDVFQKLENPETADRRVNGGDNGCTGSQLLLSSRTSSKSELQKETDPPAVGFTQQCEEGAQASDQYIQRDSRTPSTRSTQADQSRDWIGTTSTDAHVSHRGLSTASPPISGEDGGRKTLVNFLHQGRPNEAVPMEALPLAGSLNPVSQPEVVVQPYCDDTSYLQAFLSRTRAQREAKLQKDDVPTTEEHETQSRSSQPAADLPLQIPRPAAPEMPAFGALALPLETADEQGTDRDQERDDDKASSPVRRSGRITRLPLPQKTTNLPNTISLRKLNGSEFIAMHKENQILAVATRTNTKRNKGSSLNVRQRLNQLHAEKYPPLNQDKPKVGKGVEWSNVIARMQSEDGTEVTYVPDPKLMCNFDAAEIEASVEDSEIAEPVSQSEQKAVRKRRKENVGNANGTPAPRRRMQVSLADTPRSDSKEDEAVRLRVTPMKRTRSGTRSHE